MPSAEIFIVEDEPLIANALKIRLDSLGYSASIYPSGEQALDQIQVKSPDLVLMDVVLEGKLDGIQVAEKIREKLGIPVIFITAHSDEKTVKRAMAVAPFGYLLKPFQIRELQLTVELALQNHWMEKKVRESEEIYRNLTELSPNAILLLDPQGTITLCNQEAGYLFGSSAPAVVLGKNLSDLISPEDRERVVMDYQGLFIQQDNLRNIELTAIRDDGRRFPVEFNGSLVRDALGNPEKIICVIQDITARKAAEQAVLEQARRAETLARVASHINRSLESDLVLNTVCDEVAQILQVPGVAITLLEEQPDQLYVAAATGPIGELNRTQQFPFPESMQKLLREAGREAIQIPYVQSISDLPKPLRALLKDVCTVVIAPMFQENWLIGSINLATIGVTRRFNQDELNLLSAIADMAAIAISHARLFEQVASGRARLHSLSRQLVEVQEAERRHLAHELHDQIGQVLTGLQFSLEMSKVLPEKASKENIEGAQNILKDLISQVRELSLRLSPPLLEDLGLLACLEWHLDRFTSQTGIQVDFTHGDLSGERFSPEVEITIYRIIQEALTNVARHAGTDQASIQILMDERQVHLSIQDSGQGFDPQQALAGTYSVGLVGMRERANLVGGHMEIISSPGKGTTLSATFPIGDKIDRRKHGRQRVAS